MFCLIFTIVLKTYILYNISYYIYYIKEKEEEDIYYISLYFFLNNQLLNIFSLYRPNLNIWILIVTKITVYDLEIYC